MQHDRERVAAIMREKQKKGKGNSKIAEPFAPINQAVVYFSLSLDVEFDADYACL